MEENLSKINRVFEDIGKAITHNENFDGVPIKWAMYEVSPNQMPPTMIILEAKPYQYNASGCNYERQLDIIIVHNTDNEREITKRLTKYAEEMEALIANHVPEENYQLTHIQGSEIRAKRNNKEDAESYKGSKTLFSSLIVLTYFLEY